MCVYVSAIAIAITYINNDITTMIGTIDAHDGSGDIEEKSENEMEFARKRKGSARSTNCILCVYN